MAWQTSQKGNIVFEDTKIMMKPNEVYFKNVPLCFETSNFTGTTYSNGDTITLSNNSTEWNNNVVNGIGCYAIVGGVYYYNYYSVVDYRGIGGSLYHIPNNEEWLYLFDLAGGLSVAGNMKSVGTTYWNTPNTGAANNLNMNIRGYGYYALVGFEPEPGQLAYKTTGRFWSSSTSNNASHYVRFEYNSSAVTMNTVGTGTGFNIRLVKNCV